MRGAVLALVLILLLPTVYAAPAAFMTPGTDSSDCTAIDAATTLIGYVSTQGHYRPDQPSILTDYPYVLCGMNGFVLEAFPTEADFKYAIFNGSINGSNHVSVTNSTITNFSGYADIGAEYCRYSTTGCSVDESCIFKMSNPDNAHIADCATADNPYVNSFAGQLCCKIQEKCWDGIDNDGDGYMDCADSDCFGGASGSNPGSPQICGNYTAGYGSWMVTSACAIGYNSTSNQTIFNTSCIGQPPPIDTAYYCGYGINDNPVQEPTGVCCQIGEYPRLNAFGEWECFPSTQCGVGPGTACEWDILSNETGWLSEAYGGDPFDWCNSQVPNLYSPGLTNSPKSTGCCQIAKYGEVNWYIDDNNVKIWG